MTEEEEAELIAILTTNQNDRDPDVAPADVARAARFNPNRDLRVPEMQNIFRAGIVILNENDLEGLPGI